MSRRGAFWRVDSYSVVAMYAIALGLTTFDQLLPAIVVGAVASLWALWANRRSLFGTLLRKVRMRALVLPDEARKLVVPLDGQHHSYTIEVRPRIWHEVVIEMDVRITHRRGDKRANYHPVTSDIIGIERFMLEPDSPSRAAGSQQTVESNAIVVVYGNGKKLDRGRGVIFKADIEARKPFKGYLSVRTQTKDDSHMLLTQIPVETR